MVLFARSRKPAAIRTMQSKGRHLFASVPTVFPAGRGTRGKLVALGAALVGATVLGGCTPSKAKQPVQGDAEAGVSTITRHACGSCHQIPGVQAANGLVGPPLGGVAARVYLAGHLLNTPDNMIFWLRKPQAVFPGNAMPDMGLSDKEARDVAAYLYTLR
jgi:cytochrome c2